MLCAGPGPALLIIIRNVILCTLHSTPLSARCWQLSVGPGSSLSSLQTLISVCCKLWQERAPSSATLQLVQELTLQPPVRETGHWPPESPHSAPALQNITERGAECMQRGQHSRHCTLISREPVRAEKVAPSSLWWHGAILPRPPPPPWSPPSLSSASMLVASVSYNVVTSCRVFVRCITKLAQYFTARAKTQFLSVLLN